MLYKIVHYNVLHNSVLTKSVVEHYPSQYFLETYMNTPLLSYLTRLFRKPRWDIYTSLEELLEGVMLFRAPSDYNDLYNNTLKCTILQSN